MRRSGLERREVFVTSKLDDGAHRPDAARRAFARTLSELRLDDVDLFLIHWPLPARQDAPLEATWKVLEEFRARAARARSASRTSRSHTSSRLRPSATWCRR